VTRGTRPDRSFRRLQEQSRGKLLGPFCVSSAGTPDWKVALSFVRSTARSAPYAAAVPLKADASEPEAASSGFPAVMRRNVSVPHLLTLAEDPDHG
jgi:hypothetical protein